jgi:hypothetical protein
MDMRNKMRGIMTALAALFVLALAGPAAAQNYTHRCNVPDYYAVTAMARYRPVDVPGTQRRVAQTDAENDAKRQILAYVGSMQVVPGKTVNQTIAQNSRIRAKVLDIVRTSELVDWKVDPACGAVQVWMRVDLNRIRQLVSLCP